MSSGSLARSSCGARLRRVVSLLAAASVAMTYSGLAFAQAEPAAPWLPGEARGRYGAAQLLLSEGHDEAACLELRVAHELAQAAQVAAIDSISERESGAASKQGLEASGFAPHRVMLLEAVCEQRRGHHGRALALLEGFRSLAGGELSSAERALLARLVQIASASRGEVHVELTARQGAIEGAVLEVDGEPVGQWPLPKPVVLDAGAHQVVVTRDGFERLEADFFVEPKGKHHLNLELQPHQAMAQLELRGPPGAAIGVDGSVVGRGQWQGELPAGEHRVSLRRSEATSFHGNVTLLPERKHTVLVELRDRGESTEQQAGPPRWLYPVVSAALVVGAGVATYFYFENRSEQSAPHAAQGETMGWAF